jgi:hypothetical protein
MVGFLFTFQYVFVHTVTLVTFLAQVLGASTVTTQRNSKPLAKQPKANIFNGFY